MKKKIEKHVYVSEKLWWNRRKNITFSHLTHIRTYYFIAALFYPKFYLSFSVDKNHLIDQSLTRFYSGNWLRESLLLFYATSRWQRCEIAIPRKGCGTKYRGCRSLSITAELGDGSELQLQRRWYAITPLTKTNRFSSGYKIDFPLWKTARGLLGEFWLKLNYWNSYKLQTIIKRKERPSSRGRTTLAWGA